MQLDPHVRDTAVHGAMTMTFARDAALSTDHLVDPSGHVANTGGFHRRTLRRAPWIEGADARGALAARLTT